MKCCFAGCASSYDEAKRFGDNITFHSFPKNPTTRNLWLTLCNWDKSRQPRVTDKVCSLHFERSNFDRSAQRLVRLWDTALPTLSAPHETKKRPIDSTAEHIIMPVPIKKEKLDPESDEPPLDDDDSSIYDEEYTEAKHSFSFMDIKSEPVEEIVPPLPSPSPPKIEPLPPQRNFHARKSFPNMLPKSEPMAPLPRIVQAQTLTPSKMVTIPRRPISSNFMSAQPTTSARKSTSSTMVRNTEKPPVTIKFTSLQGMLTHLHINHLLTSTEFLNLKQISDDYGKQITMHIMNSKNAIGRLTISQIYKKFLLNLHFYSPKAYEYIKRKYDFALPHINAINAWYKSIRFKPGFTQEAFNKVEHAVQIAEMLGKKIVANIIIDEVGLERKIELDDSGNEEVGYVLNFDDNIYNNTEAQQVLVFMLVAVNGNFRLPLAYFPIDMMPAQQKHNLLSYCIETILRMGVELVGVSFTGNPTNITMARMLKCGMDPPDLQPTFNFESNNQALTQEKKHLMITIDPADSLLSVVNTLAVKKLLVSPEDGDMIEWKYIANLRAFYNKRPYEDMNGFIRNIIKNIDVAIQTLSTSVADAIDYCCNVLQLEEFNGADPTVRFIRFLNNSFDILNSQNFCGGGYKKSISLKNSLFIVRFVEEAIEYFMNIKILNKTTGELEPIIRTSRRTGFIGLIMGLMNIKALYRKYIVTKELKHFSAFNLSREHVNLCFQFRRSPTLKEFIVRYKDIVNSFSVSNRSHNNLPNKVLNILSSDTLEALNLSSPKYFLIKNNAINESDQTAVDLIDHEYIFNFNERGEYNDCVIRYISIFIVCNLSKTLKCETCINALYDNYIKNSSGERLSKVVYAICKITEQELIRANALNLGANQSNFNLFLLKISINVQKSLLDTKFLKTIDTHRHRSLLPKVIIEKYLQIRFFYRQRVWTRTGSFLSRLKTFVLCEEQQ